ncbi:MULTISPECIES: hypothetical protein [Olivibacter]|uniref:Uncharacterized protein n=2 Tax=Olivibacter TaxID=376469 RepID=A0ABV6HLY4_9SPHI|nr:MULTISPECIES: hypothetical protein [Olivibacter]MDM8176402.1 hypothetical protein [Olivibacter sp. 47]MDX3914544.1 hypothetical protein [Pseudosphingobacterium sp.]
MDFQEIINILDKLPDQKLPFVGGLFFIGWLVRRIYGYIMRNKPIEYYEKYDHCGQIREVRKRYRK